jgi:hypothetical protein
MPRGKKEQLLECCYCNNEGTYTRVLCNELDRGMTAEGTVADSMKNGTITFMRKNEIIAQCPPTKLSWVRLYKEVR